MLYSQGLLTHPCRVTQRNLGAHCTGESQFCPLYREIMIFLRACACIHKDFKKGWVLIAHPCRVTQRNLWAHWGKPILSLVQRETTIFLRACERCSYSQGLLKRLGAYRFFVPCSRERQPLFRGHGKVNIWDLESCLCRILFYCVLGGSLSCRDSNANHYRFYACAGEMSQNLQLDVIHFNRESPEMLAAS